MTLATETHSHTLSTSMSRWDPARIVDDPSLDTATKAELLRQLELDVRQAQVALEEGMEGGSRLPSLTEIRSAMALLGEAPSPETPTKS